MSQYRYSMTPSNYNYNSMFSNIFPYNNNYNYININKDIINIKEKERPEILSIIGIGDCIIDIISEINMSIINKYQLINNKTRYIDQNNINIFQELQKMLCVYYITGGSVQNILRTISLCLNLNIEKKYNITMLGCIGNDIYKDKIINTLIQNKINPLLKIINGENSLCAAGFYNKNPYLISDIKSSINLDKEFIESNKENILNHDILLIEGYYLLNKYDICKELCELFKNKNKIIILTLSPIILNQDLYEKFISIANYSNIILTNKSQLEDLLNLHNIENEKIFTKFFQNLSNNNKRLLIVKNGKESAYVTKYNYIGKHLEYILTSFPSKIKNEEIVDEIGYDDAFFGGFLSEYMKGSSLFLCLKKGNDIANISLKNPGCTFDKKK